MAWQSIYSTRPLAELGGREPGADAPGGVACAVLPKHAARAAPAQKDDCIAVVDDDQDVRDSLENLLGACGYDVAPFPTPDDFLTALLRRRCAPACLILDVRLKTESGLELQRTLTLSDIDIPVVIMTGHGDVAMTVQAMKQGALDVLTKPAREADILGAVAAAVRVHTVRRAERRQLAELMDRYESLSPRERQVMSLVIAGLMNKQVAAEIGLSEVTVKIHRSAVMRKMAADSLPDLVRMGERLKVRDPEVGRFTRRGG